MYPYQITSSDKYNNGWKILKWLIYCDFLHFMSIIWPCGHDNMKSFLFILLKFVMHVTNKQFSDNFDNGWIFFFFFNVYNLVQ